MGTWLGSPLARSHGRAVVLWIVPPAVRYLGMRFTGQSLSHGFPVSALAAFPLSSHWFLCQPQHTGLRLSCLLVLPVLGSEAGGRCPNYERPFFCFIAALRQWRIFRVGADRHSPENETFFFP